jgi:dimethylsulfone monooxygenase
MDPFDAGDVIMVAESTTSGASTQSPLPRALEQPLLMGLFLPLQSGAWNASTLPRSTDWSFDFNLHCALEAERLGFDLVFGLGQWMGKGGYGGAMRYREQALDPLMATAGMVARTQRIPLISTVHILYGWHPVLLAKLASTLDHMSGGRWGINAVFGYKPRELALFGMEEISYEDRGPMVEEFVTIMERLWTEDEEFAFEGRHWSTQGAFLAPKPRYGRPLMVNAGTSPAVIDYAARHSDILFITSPGGSVPKNAYATLPAHTGSIKERARQQGKDLKLLIHPMVICRETEKEAKAYAWAVLDHADPVVAQAFTDSFLQGKQASWKATDYESTVLGGNVNLIGTPVQIVDHFLKLKQCGCDGIQVSFVGFEPDLAFFGEQVIPLMKEAGLRV